MIRILLADDYTIIRKGVRQILTQAYPNAEIGEIEEGEEWTEKLKSTPWDMIISDLPQPDRGGYLALQQIRGFSGPSGADPELIYEGTACFPCLAVRRHRVSGERCGPRRIAMGRSADPFRQKIYRYSER